MAVRDRISVGLIAAGFLLAVVCWRTDGRWASVVVLVVAIAAAAVVYRIESPRDRPPLDDVAESVEQPDEVGSAQ